MVEFNYKLAFAVLVAAFGSGWQHGWNIAVLNNPEIVVRMWLLGLGYMKQNTLMWAIIVSIFAIGGLFGGLLVAIVAEGLGRKGGLIVNVFICFTATAILVLTKWVDSIYLLFVGRFIIGVNCGLGAGLCPMYLSEISPVKSRGAIGISYQLMITISILVAQLLGWEEAMGNEELWPFLFLIGGGVAALQLLGFIIVPESPKYFLQKDKNEKATKALQKLNTSKDVSGQLAEMKVEIDASKSLPKVTLKEMFTVKKYRKPLVILCVLTTAQQLSGINAVMFFSNAIFLSAGLEGRNAQLATIGVGCVNVASTIVAIFLIERIGRKLLLLINFGGMCITTVLLFLAMFFVKQSSLASWFALVLVYIYIVLFATGAGPIPWLIGPELFNTAARGLALSIAVPCNWLFTFIVGIAFPPLQNMIEHYVFLIFAVLQALSFVYILFFVPETKNRPIEDIVASFDK